MAKKKPKVDKAIRLIRETRGMSAEIARACGIERAAVYQWERVPPGRVLVVAKILNMAPRRIRPDIFGSNP